LGQTMQRICARCPCGFRASPPTNKPDDDYDLKLNRKLNLP
jgi:hypothetical protein